MKTTILLYVTALTGPVFSAPQAVSEVAETASLPRSTSTSTSQSLVDDAVDGIRPTGVAQAAGDSTRLKERMDKPPEHLTIQIINSYGLEITTAHASNAGSPTPVGGAIQPGIVPNGTTASFAVPTGWAGNVAMNRANMSINGDVTLLEASFVVADGWDFAVAGVDVSHVNGFTVPIICECNGKWVAGCKKNLFNVKARQMKPANAAINPLRADTSATSAKAFFAPCEGAAYTFPNDHAANSWGACQSGLISCCVGTACPASAPQA
ncbi:hypothetical protein J7T55_015623 [Diaporthe amygdali]|uniref:uncharacterized protein n=1 Tax=Phomopsis amygdali TaxID=1214568 RepID=UPI0022FE4D39|nr:uncharacterized protein J7T55_015623 [Diaporthe amygdali]KAJ0120886.1 hypothetical protein J7T55_015623 [Diaporthe amygdali]